MKKLIIVTLIAAFFAACGNKAANESTTKVAGLKTWVDSVSGLAAATTTYDSATWATWDADYNNVVNGIVEADLDEATKATLAETKAKWAETGTAYSNGMMKAKEEAAKAAAMATDSTKVSPEAMAPAVEPKK